MLSSNIVLVFLTLLLLRTQ